MLLTEFRQIYIEELTKEVQKHPTDYGWPIEQVPLVVDKMINAFTHKQADIGPAVKKALIRCGVKPIYRETYKFINSLT
jgi:hypothetical protein